MAQSDVPAESTFGGVVNAPDADWIELYTRDGKPRRVPPGDVQAALEEGLLPMRYDLDDAEAEWKAEMQAALDAVPKALAEARATNYIRDEDSWIINEAMSKVRDSFAHLLFAHGALLPTESQVAALKAYMLEHPNGVDPEHHLIVAAVAKHQKAIAAIPDDRMAFHRNRGEADARAQAKEGKKR